MSTPGVPVGTVADGNMLYASEDIVIPVGGTNVTYFSKTIRLSKQSNKIEGKNSAAVTFRKAYTKKGYFSGSADLLYPSVAGAAVPDELTVFTMAIPEVAAGAVKSYIITSVAPARGNDAEATCSIEFDEVITQAGVTVGS